MRRLVPLLLLVVSLSGCDQVMNAINKQTENGKAIGAACRHSGRALEDCFRRNPRVAKADIFDGWKEMNEYMLQKKLDIVPPPPDPVVQRRAEPSDKDASKTEARAQTK